MFFNSEKKTIIGKESEEKLSSSNTNTLCTNPVKNSFCEKANALRLENMFKEAVSSYLNAILIDRNNFDSYFGLGICYKHLKQYAKAIKYLDIASSIIDKSYEVFFELGICHLLDGSPCGAIKNFVCAIQLNPDNPDAILQLGMAHEMCEEYELALMIYQKLIENSPGFIKAYDHKSTLLMKLGNYKEASSVLHEILKLNPDYYKAYAGIGVCFDKLGKRSNAQRYYRKFLSEKPFSHKAEFIKNRLDKIKIKKPFASHLLLCK